MNETAVQIPNRALFKAAEVCEIARLQPYVLRSWEAEFPQLGVTRTGTAGRMYRRVDVEQVLRIKHMLFVDGLTLAGIRRRMDEDAAPVGADDLPLDELLGQNARERLSAVRQGLQGILDLLSGNGAGPGPVRYQTETTRKTAKKAPRLPGLGRRAASAGKTAGRKAAPKGKPATRKRR